MPKNYFYSKLDITKQITKFFWAVTMINEIVECPGSDELLDQININLKENEFVKKLVKKSEHASIVIEGIDDGFFSRKYYDKEKITKEGKFTYQGHLTFNGARDRFFNFDDKIEHISRSNTWMKPASEVKKMIENIKIDKLNKEIKWGMLGEKNIYKKQDPNCVQYVRRRLKDIEIDIGDSAFEWIIAVPNRFMEINN